MAESLSIIRVRCMECETTVTVTTKRTGFRVGEELDIICKDLVSYYPNLSGCDTKFRFIRAQGVRVSKGNDVSMDEILEYKIKG